MTTAEKIKAARVKANLTQQDLADLLGVHVASVRNWEGGSIPRGPMFKRLAEALLVKPEALRDDDADAATDLTVADILDEAKETLARVMGIGVERISLNATIA